MILEKRNRDKTRCWTSVYANITVERILWLQIGELYTSWAAINLWTYKNEWCKFYDKPISETHFFSNTCWEYEYACVCAFKVTKYN